MKPDLPARRADISCRTRGADGQWILLSAIIAALGLGIIMILLNMAVLNGHSSITSVTTFPKNDIRDLRSSSIEEAVVIAGEVNNQSYGISAKGDAFNDTYSKFVEEMTGLYQSHSALINISYVPNVTTLSTGNGPVSQITNVNLTIVYTDSNTIYQENVSVGTS